MANCSFCGKPVLAGKVLHTSCAAKKTAQDMTEKFCDHYCRFPRECHDDEALHHHCESCELQKLISNAL